MRLDAPLVPRQASALRVILESAKRGRFGIELGYTGKPALEYDLYRSVRARLL